MTLHTAVQTSHQVYHDVIIEVFFCFTSRLNTCLHWIGTSNLATWQMQNHSCKTASVFSPCISIPWSMKKWLGTRLSEFSSSPSRLNHRNDFFSISRLKMCSFEWYVQADDLTVAKSVLQKQRRFCIVPAHGCPNLSSSPSWLRHRNVVLLYEDSRLCSLDLHVHTTDVTLQNQSCKTASVLHRAFP